MELLRLSKLNWLMLPKANNYIDIPFLKCHQDLLLTIGSVLIAVWYKSIPLLFQTRYKSKLNTNKLL